MDWLFNNNADNARVKRMAINNSAYIQAISNKLVSKGILSKKDCTEIVKEKERITQEGELGKLCKELEKVIKDQEESDKEWEDIFNFKKKK